MKSSAFVVGLITLTWIAYGQSYSHQFVYDDQPIIVKNPLIRRLNQIPLLFGTSYWGMNIGQPKELKGSLYRPLTMTTFALNYCAAGLDPKGYHLVNILLHMGVSLLLWVLCLRLGFRPMAAATAAVLFAVLPIHTEAVSNVVGRSEVLAAFFVLLSWISLTGEPGKLGMVIGVVCFLLALLAKENSAAFLPAIVISDLFIDEQRWKDVIRQRLLVWVALGGSLLLYLQWRYLILGHALSTGGADYFTSQSPLTIALTMSNYFMLHYAGPLISGTGLCAEYSRPAFPDARIHDLAPWLYAASAAALIGAALYGTIVKRSKPVLYVLIFFALLSPVCNLMIKLQVIGAERFLYLPSIGYCMGLGLFFSSIFDAGGRQASWVLTVLIGLCCWYTWKSFQRNHIWKTEESFWTSTVQDSPQSPRAWNGLGVAMLNQGKYGQALQYFETALRLDPSLIDASYNIAECYFSMGNFVEAKKRFSAVLQQNPFDRDTLLYLAVLAEKERDYRSAGATYAKILAINPGDRTARRNLALLHCRVRDFARCRLEIQSYPSGSPAGGE